MHLNTELLFRKYCTNYFKNNIKVLEIGGQGSTTFKNYINNSTITWNTLDINLQLQESSFENDHIISNKEYSYPIDDASYDVIISANVIEHVKMIWKWSKELSRIIKPGGFIITLNPVSWPYHLAPVDCWRIYPEGAVALWEDAGMKIVLSKFESLELEYFGYGKYNNIAGFYVGNFSLANFSPENLSRGIQYKLSKSNRIRIIYNIILSKIPVARRMMVPLNVAIDTITIAQK